MNSSSSHRRGSSHHLSDEADDCGPRESTEELVPQETSAHALRHTFARSYLAQYPGDVVELATLLEHSSLDTTRLYSEPWSSN